MVIFPLQSPEILPTIINTNKVEKWIVELRIAGVGENGDGDTEAGAQGSKLRRKHL